MSELRVSTEIDGAEATMPAAGPREEFIKLFTKYQRRVFLFILSQVPNPVDAEEIHQEANVIIWRKFDRFELGTNFLAWACPAAASSTWRVRSRSVSTSAKRLTGSRLPCTATSWPTSSQPAARSIRQSSPWTSPPASRCSGYSAGLPVRK